MAVCCPDSWESLNEVSSAKCRIKAWNWGIQAKGRLNRESWSKRRGGRARQRLLLHHHLFLLLLSHYLCYPYTAPMTNMTADTEAGYSHPSHPPLSQLIYFPWGSKDKPSLTESDGLQEIIYQ